MPTSLLPVRFRNACWLGLFAASGFAWVPPARAEMRVIDSNSPNYEVGDVLNDNTHFRLGVGCHVRVLKTPSNETALIEGDKSSKPPKGVTRGDPPSKPCP